MYEIFEQLLQKYGISQYKVSKDTGISQSTFSSWKTRGTKISMDKAEILAKYFDVSIDYLMNGKESDSENSLEAKDNEERELLLLCRKVGDISEEDRNQLIDLFKNNIDIYMKAKGLK